MKKIILPVICSIFALAIGYLIGGMRAGRIATEQAYHSDLSYLVALTRNLEENKIEEAKETSRYAIQGALGVLKTFENEPRSPLVFLLPYSQALLDRETRESIRSQAKLTLSEEVVALRPIPEDIISRSRNDN